LLLKDEDILLVPGGNTSRVLGKARKPAKRPSSSTSAGFSSGDAKTKDVLLTANDVVVVVPESFL